MSQVQLIDRVIRETSKDIRDLEDKLNVSRKEGNRGMEVKIIQALTCLYRQDTELGIARSNYL